jgi:hypothetical protein
LRKVLLLADRVNGVDVERQADLVRWSPPSDLATFETAIERRELADAIAVGAPPLLQGFEVADGPRSRTRPESHRCRG